MQLELGDRVIPTRKYINKIKKACKGCFRRRYGCSGWHKGVVGEVTKTLIIWHGIPHHTFLGDGVSKMVTKISSE